ncbi:prepilin-type N-terminal cleavage/methylation domain-containing protein [Candidatus Berkiella cookevillensis]|uniref:Prepilin-type N-terminal cleavage/methylation domain-containing protein n=1 Tax=Candidatus Berkiella cookevillensis TaxID=437022 RepID=A0A0Q9YCX9_9GAMM|nr:prepilin-type N-terminal cleavage/methylation domain-containing protein [Candidatus Berkiella cookevillensis]MCS5708060.1 prepilin-type N-terminal cleavage/methylation domain-containing protein [Candidatus Berkiella cookevillensis]
MKREEFIITVSGMTLIEVLVSLSIFSTVLLACMAFSLNALQRCRDCLRDTEAVNEHSTSFERSQLSTQMN